MTKFSLFFTALLFTCFANASTIPQDANDKDTCPGTTTWSDGINHCVDTSKALVDLKCPDGTLWSEVLPFAVPPPKSMPTRDPSLHRCVRVKQVARFELVDATGKNYGYAFGFMQAERIKQDLMRTHEKKKLTITVINNRTHTIYPD
ncbi:hypothetical protein ACO0LB_17795 [Undibacterium sp. SXout7W]|uniref:hypothetical protein n=1 Tax=Undibacterium sp. SXout7W TaxID=3413049 RepID=UPI003BF2C7D0